jgi:hypothetical protein
MMTSPQIGTGQEDQQFKLQENVLNNKQFHVLTFLVAEIGSFLANTPGLENLYFCSRGKF